MRMARLQSALLALSLTVTGSMVVTLGAPYACAQSNISGDIAGTAVDPSGAVISNAVVTVTSVEKGDVKKVNAEASGNFRVSLLSPGKYKVLVSAPGFESSSYLVTVSAGVASTVRAQLTVGKASTTIEVSSDAIQVLDTESAELTTTFDLQDVQNLPNPGGDLTFVAQTTSGAVMNTQAGYGNFSVNGLPGTANNFTVNGGYEGDPFLNLNNSGATNLTLGNNDVQTVSVISSGFDAAFGGLGGAQVNEISRSGTNAYHGNLLYQWNGRVLNANSFFNKQSGVDRNFDNANQWAAAVGGPIKRDKIFFFVNTEGLRVVIPTADYVYAPSPAYQTAVLAGAGLGDSTLVPYGNLNDNGNGNEASLYKKIFAYYNNARNFSKGEIDPSGDPSVWRFRGQATNFAREWIITDRVDFNLGANDSLFIHSKVDQGTQPTFTSYLSSDFTAESPQPSYEGQLNETHTFSPNLTNQFLFSASYYRAIFVAPHAAKVAQDIPFVLATYGEYGTTAAGNAGSWNNGATGFVGGEDYAFPQGRNVTGYQFNDDLSWNKGKHNFKFGYTFRRNDLTDYSPQTRTYANAGAIAYVYDEADFATGYIDRWGERFPTRSTQPIALYVSGAYVQDQWKPTPNLTITAGLRIEHNSNPICRTYCISNLSADIGSLTASTTTSYNSIFASGRQRAYFSQQNIGWQPRLSFAWLPFGQTGKTTVRGGFGLFNDYFPATIVDSLINNTPTKNYFLVNGEYFGSDTVLDPTQSTSGHAYAVNSNKALSSGFASGASYSTLSSVKGFTRPAATGIAHHVSLPQYIEWTFGLEREIYRNTALKTTYVGNRTYHQPIATYPNMLNSTAGTIASLPNSRTYGALNQITMYYNGGYSNYNAFQAVLASRLKWSTVTVNYTWSHGLDTVSNGGFLAFGDNNSGQINPKNLRQNYGNSDYDVRHYISASYVINIPHTKGPSVLVDNWSLAGTVFHNNGYPFSVTDNSGNTSYGSVPLAKQLDNNFDHHCKGIIHTINQCDFASHFTTATDFGQQKRNQLYGPNYTDFDLDLSKGFVVPSLHNTKFELAFQFFNLFNHPNFSQPDFDINDSTYGVITSAAGTPTSILGAGLGGDATPRLIQLKLTAHF